MNLYLIRGLPGSGKTTFARLIMNNPLCDCDGVVEADQFFTDKDGKYNFDYTKIREAHAWCQSQTRKFLEQGVSVAVSNTFTQEWEMQPYFNMAKEFGYTVHTIIVENRHGGENGHGVPADKVKIMKDRFEIKL